MSWIRGDCIGRGAYGSVNLGLNKANGNVFAVKSVDQVNSSPSQLEALENEIRILRQVSSPYVVEYIGDDISSEGTSSYRNLHMEYMPGGTLSHVAKISAGGLDEGIIQCYAWCIVSALNYLHSQRIIHCDVKGQNVLLGPNQRIAKLADFGSAVELGGTGVPRGSPLWMAPEVVRGEYQGPESDVWSIGCTVIEMVTGKPPWETRSSAADTLCLIGYSEAVPVIPSRLSAVGKDFINKCLKREKSERWSCDQLLRHPFLLSCSQSDVGQSLFPSPRGVLDWFSSEEEEDDDYADIECRENRDNYEISFERYRNYISGVASRSEALWESNGWFVVREREDVEVKEYTGEITNLEYYDSNVNLDGIISLEIETQSENIYDDVVNEDGELNHCEYKDTSSFQCGLARQCEKMHDNWCTLMFFVLNFYIILLNSNLIKCSQINYVYLTYSFITIS